MNKYFFLFAFITIGSLAQTSVVGQNYLEDQFYFGLTYNALQDKSMGIKQRNLPYGIQLGYIKDMPINKKRTISIGVGLGYALNSYYSNIIASKAISGELAYYIFEDIKTFQRSKIEMHLIEVPIEFRWRKSTPTSYKFLRIYTGFKFGYVISGRSKYVNYDYKESFSNPDIQKFRYGIQFNIGYNTWTMHVYYGLNNILNNATIEGEPINIKPLRIGFNFYIL